MPKKKSNRTKIAAFEQHGVVIASENDTQYIASCPFCGAYQKMYISKEGSVWDCKVCGMEGNLKTFFAERMKQYRKNITKEHKQKIQEEKGIRPNTLTAWGVGYATDKKFFAIPISNGSPEHVHNIKRYTPGPGSKMINTKDCRVDFLHPLERVDSSRVWICEGEWDAMALWQAMPKAHKEDVVAAPGCNIVPVNESLSQFQNRDVVLAFDNDVPGQKGAVKLAKTLQPIARSVRCVKWPSETPEGYDVRDFFVKDKHKFFGLIELVQDAPREELLPVSEEKPKYTGMGVSPLEVMKVFSKWLYLDSFDCLDVLFGTVFANRLPGDPVWMFLVAPPGGAKTELILSLRDAPGTISTSSLTPASLITGQQFNSENDPSLIPQLNHKILFIKDFTAILNLNQVQRDEIFGILRDAYDGFCEKHFGWGKRHYQSTFGILAGVTPVVEQMNAENVSMGERFLRYNLYLKEAGHQDQSREAIRRALSNTEKNDDMKRELREIAHRVVNVDVSNKHPSVPEDMQHRIVLLAELVSRMRAAVSRDKYTREVMTKPVHEVGTRLAKQLKKLAQGIAIYNRENVVSGKTYQILIKVARSTIPSRNEDILRQLYIHDELDTKELAKKTGLPSLTIRSVMENMMLLGIVRKREEGWTLSKKITRTMREIGMFSKERQYAQVTRTGK